MPQSLEVCCSPQETHKEKFPQFFDGLGSKNTCFFPKTIFVTAVSVVPISFTSVAQRKPSLYLDNVFTSETKSKEPHMNFVRFGFCSFCFVSHKPESVLGYVLTCDCVTYHHLAEYVCNFFQPSEHRKSTQNTWNPPNFKTQILVSIQLKEISCVRWSIFPGNAIVTTRCWAFLQL